MTWRVLTLICHLMYWILFGVIARKLCFFAGLPDIDNFYLFLAVLAPLVMVAATLLLNVIISGESNAVRVSRIQLVDFLSSVGYSTCFFFILQWYTIHDWEYLQGIFFFFILAIKMIQCAIVLIQRETEKNAPPHQLLIVSFFFILMFGIGSWTWTLSKATGDEPHYLLIAESLLSDGDTNLADEYKEQVYRSYYDGLLSPKPSDIVEEERIYSAGLGVFFPVLILPGYGVLGRAGAMITMELVAAFLAGLCFTIYRKEVNSPVIAWYTICVIFLGLPLALMSHQIYPDILAALFVTLAFTYISDLFLPGLSSKERRWRTEMVLFCSVLLCLLRFRYMPIVAMLLFLVMWSPKSKRRTIFFALSVLVIALGGYLLLDKLLLGGELFFNRFGKLYQIRAFLPGLKSVFSLNGLMLGQEEGALIVAPGLLLAFFAARMRKSLNLLPLFIALPYILILSGHRAWHSLPTPPLRYLTPVIPILGIYVAQGINYLFTKQRNCFFSLLGSIFILGSVTYAFLVILVPDWRYNLADGTNALCESLSKNVHYDVTKLLPSFTRISWITLVYVAFAYVILYYLLKHRLSPMISGVYFLIAAISLFVLFTRCWWEQVDPRCAVYEMEDFFDISHEGGNSYPYPKDPFFYKGRLFGWSLFETGNIFINAPATQSNELWEVVSKSHNSEALSSCGFGEKGRKAQAGLLQNLFWTPLLFTPSRSSGQPIIAVHKLSGKPIAIDKCIKWIRDERLGRLYARLASVASLSGYAHLSLELERRGLLYQFDPVNGSISSGQSTLFAHYIAQYSNLYPISARIFQQVEQFKIDKILAAYILSDIALSREKIRCTDLTLFVTALQCDPLTAFEVLNEKPDAVFFEVFKVFSPYFSTFPVELIAELMTTEAYVRAIEVTKLFLDSQPDSVDLSILAAWSYYKAGQMQRARWFFRQSLHHTNGAEHARKLSEKLGYSWEELQRSLNAKEGTSRTLLQQSNDIQ